MNRSIPKIDSRVFIASDKRSLADITHIALPISKVGEGPIEIDLNRATTKALETKLSLSFSKEIEKINSSFLAKVGDIWEIPLDGSSKVSRIYLVGVGDKSENDLRKIGSALGRRVKGHSAHLLSFIPTTKRNALTHLVALVLSTYTWSEKTGKAPDTPRFTIVGDYDAQVERAKVLIENTWRARDLIHTPSNIKSPSWVASQARILAKHPQITVKVRSGKELSEFGGLRAVGNSSRKNPPRFVEVSYKPRGATKAPHIVLVGKGITFDTGGVSLKRPYDMMTAMKTDMAGAAAVLMTTVAAAQLGLKVRVTALLMLAENALSGTSQRPSDVIHHYGGTTVEVINTDAEGRLVLADGLAYADMHLDPDYLIDVATLTGAATLGLSRYYGAMYTRNQKVASKLHEIGEYIGDRIWHMPLIDDYQIALESDIADFNHTADKGKFQAGSVTAALFLEKFAGKRNWIHLDIAGPARSEVDAGENPKGGTGYGVRLLTEWLASL